MPEYREVPLTGEPVLIAPERASRPRVGGTEGCPFCPGNEAETPPEVAVYRERGTANAPGWHVRAFPNRYPAVVPPVGVQEVIVDDPSHAVVLSPASLLMYRERFAAYDGLRGVQSIALFKNVGRAAGASLAHPHAQLFALSVAAPRTKRLWANGWAHFVERKVCYWCALASGTPSVYSNADFVVVPAPVPRFAGELMLLPIAHQASFAALQPSAAAHFVQAFDAVRNRLGEAYNVIFYSPLRAGNSPGLHWHVSLAPRRSIAAGFEFATGITIVSGTPHASNQESAERAVM